jgi:uncharacterized protein (TIGR03435 family)
LKVSVRLLRACLVVIPIAVTGYNVSCGTETALLAQSAEPRFDAVSIKAVSTTSNGAGQRGTGVFSLPAGTAEVLISYAFGVPRYRVVDGPAWIASDRFQVLAKAAGSPTRAEMQLMVQQLLADRFGLVAHRESRERPTYDLVMARSDRRLGPNLKPAPVDCTPYVNGDRPPSEGPTIERAGRIVPRCGTVLAWGNGFQSPMLLGRTMPQLAEYLSGQTSRDVVDKTGLSGVFDLDLTFATEPVTPFITQLPRGDAPALLTALPEQLGLKLVSAKGAVDVLVIDHIERPSEN